MGALLLAACLAVAAPTVPGADPVAELDRLAGKEAWSALDARYEALGRAGVVLPEEAHALGVRAAWILGNTLAQRERLAAGGAGGQDAIADLDARYGRVHLVATGRRPPELSRDEDPGAPDERRSIAWARGRWGATGAFDGLLPAGTYRLGDCVTLEVVPGAGPLAVTVPRRCAAPEGALRESAARGPYVGPVAHAGTRALISPAPASPGSAGEPADLVGGGLVLGGGFEFGRGRSGLAATASYGNVLLALGAHTTRMVAHEVTAGLEAVHRRGPVRLSLGPSYGVLAARGDGVASPREDTVRARYRGTAFVGGARVTAGSTPRGPSLAVSWHTDGRRSYTALGLLFALAPAPRRLDG